MAWAQPTFPGTSQPIPGTPPIPVPDGLPPPPGTVIIQQGPLPPNPLVVFGANAGAGNPFVPGANGGGVPGQWGGGQPGQFGATGPFGALGAFNGALPGAGPGLGTILFIGLALVLFMMVLIPPPVPGGAVPPNPFLSGNLAIILFLVIGAVALMAASGPLGMGIPGYGMMLGGQGTTGVLLIGGLLLLMLLLFRQPVPPLTGGPTGEEFGG